MKMIQVLALLAVFCMQSHSAMASAHISYLVKGDLPSLPVTSAKVHTDIGEQERGPNDYSLVLQTAEVELTVKYGSNQNAAFQAKEKIESSACYNIELSPSDARAGSGSKISFNLDRAEFEKSLAEIPCH